MQCMFAGLCTVFHAHTGCPMSTVVGLSLGVAAIAYLLGLGTASAIVCLCIRKRSG